MPSVRLRTVSVSHPGNGPPSPSNSPTSHLSKLSKTPTSFSLALLRLRHSRSPKKLLFIVTIGFLFVWKLAEMFWLREPDLGPLIAPNTSRKVQPWQETDLKNVGLVEGLEQRRKNVLRRTGEAKRRLVKIRGDEDRPEKAGRRGLDEYQEPIVKMKRSKDSKRLVKKVKKVLPIVETETDEEDRPAARKNAKREAKGKKR